MTAINWAQLREPFRVDQLEWRVGRVSADGRYASLLTYVTARAVQDRLDDVFGPAGWSVVFEAVGTGWLCTIGVRTDDGWVEKTDGADPTDIEAYKGGLSGAMKRAAVQWGIGRYLYALEETWHAVQPGRSRGAGVDVTQKGKGHVGHVPWPELPSWAVPPGSPTRYGSEAIPGITEAPPERPQQPAPPAQGRQETAACPLCGKEMWDNTKSKRNPRAPDYKCKDRLCDGAVWLTPKPERQTAAGGSEAMREPGDDGAGEGPPPPGDDDIPF